MAGWDGGVSGDQALHSWGTKLPDEGWRDTETLPGEPPGRENTDTSIRSKTVVPALEEGEATACWMVDTHEATATLQGGSGVSEPFPPAHSRAQD